MRFREFLRTTVLVSGAAASLLAAVTVGGVATGHGDSFVGEVAAGWWVAAALIGVWVGRRADASPPIARLLADARAGRSLPETNPARTLVNRLWPLLVMCFGSAAIGVVLPQVSAIAAGFAIVWTLGWRRQSSAVAAIEDRDGAAFFVEHTSPLKPIRLVRTPGFRSVRSDLDGRPEPTASGRPSG
ncbi:MAG TPA: hypothetical protein VMF07_15165 [Solirubrobacteraceae bacterium]|nr:hypothetical protein [Solirubrobacteraceae bacterium]